MGFLETILASVIANVAGRQVYDGGPKLSAWLVKKAAQRLSTLIDRERREEEWLAHLHDMPGLAGLYHALGSLIASYRMLLPFENVVLPWTLWVIYRLTEAGLHYMVMVPYCRKMEATAVSVSKAEAEAALDYACKIVVYRMFIQIICAQILQMNVDRALIRKTVLAFFNIKDK